MTYCGTNAAPNAYTQNNEKACCISVFILEGVPFALPCSTGVTNVPIENLYVQSSQIFGGTFTDYKMAMYVNLTAVEFRVTAAPGS